MDSQLIIDGRVVALDEYYGDLALKKLEEADTGNTLVALSHNGRVLVRWVNTRDAEHIVPIVQLADANKRTRGVQPTKKRCPWLYDNVETEFDHVVTEHSNSLENLHASIKNEMIGRGKRPQSYRRWLKKVKNRWVRTVVAHGRRPDSLETLVSDV
jgi:hypothetical protein